MGENCSHTPTGRGLLVQLDKGGEIRAVAPQSYEEGREHKKGVSATGSYSPLCSRRMGKKNEGREGGRKHRRRHQQRTAKGKGEEEGNIIGEPQCKTQCTETKPGTCVEATAERVLACTRPRCEASCTAASLRGRNRHCIDRRTGGLKRSGALDTACLERGARDL